MIIRHASTYSWRLLKRSRRFLFAIALFFAAAATPSTAETSPEKSYPHAIAFSICAPWDGPAVALRLSEKEIKCGEESGEYVELRIWSGSSTLSGKTIKLDGSVQNREGHVSIHNHDGQFIPLEKGTIQFKKFDNNSEISGEVDLFFKGNLHERGSFSAQLCPGHALCG